MEAIKGGEFLIKETNCDAIYISNEFSEEQEMMKEAVQDFIDREVWPHKKRFENKEYDFTIQIMKQIADLGLLGINVPEEYGGLGMGFVSTILVCDYLSGASGSLSTAYGAHTGIGIMPILLYGSEEQKKHYIPKLVSGEWFGAYCLTEPDAGSDANSGKTKAVLSEDGTHYSITGQKMWITNAGFCKLMIVFARIEDDKNITAFIVEYDKENPNGISLGEEEHKLGIHASSTRQVFFDDTKVPIQNMLSERGKGFKIALNSLNVGRIKLASANIDACRRLTSESVKYANERIQFKVPISSFGAIKFKLAEMATKTYVSEAAVYRASKDIQNRIDVLSTEGKTHQEAELLGVEEFAIECAMLKVYASEMTQFVTDEGIQIFGGMGFSKDTPMEAAWRDARIGRIYEGTNEINRLLSVGMLLKKAMNGGIDIITPAMEVGKSLLGIPSFEIPDFSILLSEEKAMIANLKKVFLMISGKAVQTYGMELEKNQQVIMANAEIMMEIYMAESTILKTEKLIKMTSEEDSEIQIAMAKLNLFNAIEMILKKGKEAILEISEGDEQKMLLMGLKRFTKYSNNPNPIALRKLIADKLIKENSYCF